MESCTPRKCNGCFDLSQCRQHAQSVADDPVVGVQSGAPRADAVILNGGLGLTVDDLSQDIAAEAAGVELETRQEWLAVEMDLDCLLPSTGLGKERVDSEKSKQLSSLR